MKVPIKSWMVMWLLIVFSTSFQLHGIDFENDSNQYIIEHSTLLGDAPCSIYTLSMEIGQTNGIKNRTIEIYKEESDPEIKFLTQIVEPVFLQNMKLLFIKDNRNEARWLKTSRGVKRISSSMGNDQPLFDSDFSTSDLLSRDWDDYNLTKVNSLENIYIILAESKDNKDIRKIYIDKCSSLIVRVDYLDKNSIMYKQYKVIEKQEVDGKEFPEISIMEHALEGTYTKLTIRKIEFPLAIPSRIFNSNLL